MAIKLKSKIIVQRVLKGRTVRTIEITNADDWRSSGFVELWMVDAFEEWFSKPWDFTMSYHNSEMDRTIILIGQNQG